jgi:cation diffusion facilitator CzcD-associated flavoprotein CzcO
MEASMRTEFIDTLIIGGGQAGLAMSHMLSQSRIKFYLSAQARNP